MAGPDQGAGCPGLLPRASSQGSCPEGPCSLCRVGPRLPCHWSKLPQLTYKPHLLCHVHKVYILYKLKAANTLFQARLLVLFFNSSCSIQALCVTFW